MQAAQHLPFKKLSVLHCNTYVFFDENEILYCAADSNYTNIYLCSNKNYRISKPLATVAQMLSPEIFIRVNQSYLVNINRITRFNREKCFIIIDETELKVSCRYKSKILKTLTRNLL